MYVTFDTVKLCKLRVDQVFKGTNKPKSLGIDTDMVYMDIEIFGQTKIKQRHSFCLKNWLLVFIRYKSKIRMEK